MPPHHKLTRALMSHPAGVYTFAPDSLPGHRIIVVPGDDKGRFDVYVQPLEIPLSEGKRALHNATLDELLNFDAQYISLHFPVPWFPFSGGTQTDSPSSNEAHPTGTPFDDAYAAHPDGVINESLDGWRVYVEPSTVTGRHDVWIQDKSHPVGTQSRACVYPDCEYADIRLWLLHLTSCAPQDMLQSDQWGPRPF